MPARAERQPSGLRRIDSQPWRRARCRPSTRLGRRMRVALVCDFFHPSVGGVENHLYELAQGLLRRGHTAIVITHRYGSRVGVHWLPGGLKVYYLPFTAVYDRSLLPTTVQLLPWLRDILHRERIDVVHAHAVCTMSFEAVVLAAEMRYPVVYTEHSNYGTTRLVERGLNRLATAVLLHADAVIAVSRACLENVALRCRLDPSAVSVIPNAVDVSRFQPSSTRATAAGGRINVVVVSRLVWRKGTSLLADLIPEVCRRHPRVHFLICGDGPKRDALETMVARHGLAGRVELLGAVPHARVPAVLCRAHVFLSTSLTEAFCMSLLEAAACGLAIVSTNVGGVPEVLPAHMLTLAEPNAPALTAALSSVLDAAAAGSLPDHHRTVSTLCRAVYSWDRTAAATEAVYRRVLATPRRPVAARLRTLCARLGLLLAPLALGVIAAQYILLGLLSVLQPMARRAVSRADDESAMADDAPPNGAAAGEASVDAPACRSRRWHGDGGGLAASDATGEPGASALAAEELSEADETVNRPSGYEQADELSEADTEQPQTERTPPTRRLQTTPRPARRRQEASALGKSR